MSDLLVAQAQVRLAAGDWRDAIDVLRRALTDDPDHANAHAVLALALISGKRLTGAAAEARKALSLDGDSSLCHYAAAAALHAGGRSDEAWAHCQVALVSPIDHETDIAVHVLGAEIRERRGERDEARTLLVDILGRAQSTRARVALARIELAAGRPGEASRHADDALRDNPRHAGAHVIAGQVDLAQGDVAAAERHARVALEQNSSDRDAIRLWTAIKAARSWPIGVGWRISGWLASRSDDRQVGLLVSAFLVVQLGMILATVLGRPGLQSILLWTWVGFCIATFYAPVAFEKWLARDLTARAREP